MKNNIHTYALSLLEKELKKDFLNVAIIKKMIKYKENKKDIEKEKNGIGILTNSSFIFITEDITTKKNSRSILKNKQTDKYFIGKNKRLLNDEIYLEYLVENTLFKNILNNKLLLKKDFLDALLYLEDSIQGFNVNKILNHQNTLSLENILKISKGIGEKITAQALFYCLGKGKIKDNDNALALMNDCLETTLKTYNINFNDKNISNNIATRIDFQKL